MPAAGSRRRQPKPTVPAMPEDRRHEDRWEHLSRVAFRSTRGEARGKLINVSERGVFVRTDSPPEEGDAVQIEMSSSETEIQLLGEIRWVGTRADGLNGFGAALSDPSPVYLDLVRGISVGAPPEGATPRRVADRIPVSVPVAVEMGSMCDEGRLRDLSISGALLEGTRVQPADGECVELTFTLEGCAHGFQLRSRVTRRTRSGGYAVEFETRDPELEQLLLLPSVPQEGGPSPRGQSAG